jgi:hypothetical protein
MGNRTVPFGLAIGVIVLVAGVVGTGVYRQSVSFSNGDPAVVPVVTPQIPLEKAVTTKAFRNNAYGLEFSYSPEWGDIDMANENSVEQLFINKGDNWVFQLNTQTENPGKIDFYNISEGTAVDNWVIKKQGKAHKDEGDGYFSNKIGQEFDVAGLKTLHLVNRQLQGGSYDEFYFVKDGRLFVLTIANDPSMREDLNLNDESQWYTQLLKSFRITNVQ